LQIRPLCKGNLCLRSELVYRRVVYRIHAACHFVKI